MLNKQQTFDKVALHLLTQGERSQAPDSGTCLYRGPNGLMCGIGPLIPDDRYDKKTCENKGVHDLPPTVLAGVLEPSVFKGAFLRDLQMTHDEFSPDEWPNELKQIATEHNLDYAVVSNWEMEHAETRQTQED